MEVLIADDEATSRLIMTAALRKHGHNVYCTENGEEAWAAFQKHVFPIVVTDWLMPKMDGLELCARIRAFPKRGYSYLILLTVMGGKANFLKGMQAGADDFLVKPCDDEQLQARLCVAERIMGLREHVKRLEGLLSMCSRCKGIRNNGGWEPLEKYLSEHSDVTIEETLCPSCTAQVQPERERYGIR